MSGIELIKKTGEDYIHKSGRTLQLYLCKGDIDYTKNNSKPVKENMYVLLDKDGYDIVGEYMSFKKSVIALQQDILNS